MQKFVESAESNKENIIRSIKEYQGYSSTKERSITDQAFREYLIQKLNLINKELSKIEKLLLRLFDPGNVDPLKQIRSGVKILIGSLEKPCYANQTFFKKENINIEKLAQLYNYDFHLKDQVEILNDELHQFDSNTNDMEFADFLNHLFDLSDGLNQALTEKEFLIMSE